MNKPMVKEQTKKRPGDIVMTSQGWYQVKRGGKFVPWVRRG